MTNVNEADQDHFILDKKWLSWWFPRQPLTVTTKPIHQNPTCTHCTGQILNPSAVFDNFQNVMTLSSAGLGFWQPCSSGANGLSASLRSFFPSSRQRSEHSSFHSIRCTTAHSNMQLYAIFDPDLTNRLSWSVFWFCHPRPGCGRCLHGPPREDDLVKHGRGERDILHIHIRRKIQLSFFHSWTCQPLSFFGVVLFVDARAFFLKMQSANR